MSGHERIDLPFICNNRFGNFFLIQNRGNSKLAQNVQSLIRARHLREAVELEERREKVSLELVKISTLESLKHNLTIVKYVKGTIYTFERSF